MRCSDPAVVSAAGFIRWIRRDEFAARPASPLAGARAAFKVLLGAPVRSVELTVSPSGERIRDYLLAHRRGLRSRVYGQSILSIPPRGDPMLIGRRFQAARTNIIRARREGITCRELSDAERPRVLRQLNAPDSLLEPSVRRWWIAETPDGSPMGFAVATVDEKWAMLELLVVPRYTARYLLHTRMVCSLQLSRVRYLLGGTGLVLPSGVLYLQARLGYEIANLQLAPGKQSPDSRGRVTFEQLSSTQNAAR